jgi:hypothetical protein
VDGYGLRPTLRETDVPENARKATAVYHQLLESRPSNESHYVEQTPDRGACRWCRTQIAVPTAHSFECTKCGAHLGADDARALLPRLLAECQASKLRSNEHV